MISVDRLDWADRIIRNNRNGVVPGARYVDDFYGLDIEGTTVSGGYCASVLCGLLGFPTEAKKSETLVLHMVLLMCCASAFDVAVAFCCCVRRDCVLSLLLC